MSREATGGVAPLFGAKEVPEAESRLTPHELPRWTLTLALAMAVGLGAFLRLWQLNTLGFNSDEAVYAGQAASIAGDPTLSHIFPIFRAHPLLFQFILSLPYGWNVGDLLARLLAVAFGLATILVVYRLGHALYGRTTGLVSALFMAIMPYHVVVSRQALLDVPMTFFATVTLLLLARYAATNRPAYLYGAAGSLGLTFLSKETSLVLLPASYAFLALSPSIKARLKHALLSLLLFALVIAPFPIAIWLGGAADTAQNFLVWQLFRPANHSLAFYAMTVPSAIGLSLVLAAIYAVWRFRGEEAWRQRLLLCWIALPLAFFQLWPVKGYQYLLPIAPPIAILAAAGLVRASSTGFTFGRFVSRGRRLHWLAISLVSLTLLGSSWSTIERTGSSTFLAGTGGVPGGREVGLWLRGNVPTGTKLLTIGPSMANVLQFYGHRRAFGLSVSPNPLHRNPAYEPVFNPDLQLRSGEFQYVVWDSFSAARSPFFATTLLTYVRRYHGRVVHTESIAVGTAEGTTADRPIIVIYEIHP